LITELHKDWAWPWIFIVWYELPFISSYFVLVLAIAEVVVKVLPILYQYVLLIKTIVNSIGNTKKVLPIVLKQYKYCNINNPGGEWSEGQWSEAS